MSWLIFRIDVSSFDLHDLHVSVPQFASYADNFLLYSRIYIRVLSVHIAGELIVMLVENVEGQDAILVTWKDGHH